MTNKKKLRLNKVKSPKSKAILNSNIASVNDLNENIDINQINKLEDSDDGSTVYEIGEPSDGEEFDNGTFDANLALTMSDRTLAKLSTHILECLEEDISARQPWLDIHDKVKKYLGYDVEDLENTPFDQACRTYDTTLSNGMIRFCATARSEMLPEGGPCGHKIFGQSDERLEEVAKVRSSWMNYFLTVKDAAYYKDFENCFHYTGFYGTTVKKVYYDDFLKQPVSRFILPENFLVNIDCLSMRESDRLTHILKLPARDILSNQKAKVYRKVDLPYLKIGGSDGDDSSDKAPSKMVNVGNYTQRSLHDVYESHIHLNLEIFEPNYASDEIEDVAKPYIVTLDKESKEILSIKRNWKEEDDKFNRRQYFVPYHYLPGFDIWGLGLARLAGTNAVAVTTMLRQAVDAASYQNIPAGLFQGGTTKLQKTNMTLGPGVYGQLPSTGGSINDSFKNLPANGPSEALIRLRQELVEQLRDQTSTTEMGMMDSKEDIPTGTAVAFLEETNKIQSSVLKSLHISFSEELRLLEDVFRETIEKEEFFIDGENHIITKEHFIETVQVTPVSDPSVNSTMQKVLRAEAMFQTAMQMPDKVNTTELLKNIFKAQGLSSDDIDLLIIKDEEVEPANPISENMSLMKGEPVKAGLHQNHEAHMIVHSALDSEEAKAHIQDHMALKFQIDMQLEMDVDLSQIDPNDYEMQNALALKSAEAVMSLGLTDNDEEDAEGDLEQRLVAADIEQKREANLLKSQTDAMKLEFDTKKLETTTQTDMYKTQMGFEEAKYRMDAEKEREEFKAESIEQQLTHKSDVDREREERRIAADNERELIRERIEMAKLKEKSLNGRQI